MIFHKCYFFPLTCEKNYYGLVNEKKIYFRNLEMLKRSKRVFIIVYMIYLDLWNVSINYDTITIFIEHLMLDLCVSH